jgi:hypothetical protein
MAVRLKSHVPKPVGTVEPCTTLRKKSGAVRDATIEYLSNKDEASVSQIMRLQRVSK